MGKQRVKFTFPEDLVTQSVIYEMGHKFEVVTNIRRADVREDVGWVVLEVDGADDEIRRSVDWVRSIGVRVDPVGGDVIDG